eukprot:CAMPEP_0119328136 /NCGR_PEP_ID=MMETSP1333-20130426/72550_1 /TAXON_ID=418940 /ORGANISM="Scyphosphaera apsteinii, Strain RCC1455" /LENGTH=125 /DNA_ID=CAMNT_0007336909 /DNA_START=21 /DNA_END=395 /DNA_ORIENTATION=-
MIDKLQGELECDMTLQGATGLEDKLQVGVPEILSDLRAAGVKIWMLTGDKVGTAKNIATACNILPRSATVLELTAEAFPVLGYLKTSEMLQAKQQLDLVLSGLHCSHHPRWLQRLFPWMCQMPQA